jgi:hypothetical protein
LDLRHFQQKELAKATHPAAVEVIPPVAARATHLVARATRLVVANHIPPEAARAIRLAEASRTPLEAKATHREVSRILLVVLPLLPAKVIQAGLARPILLVGQALDQAEVLHGVVLPLRSLTVRQQAVLGSLLLAKITLLPKRSTPSRKLLMMPQKRNTT